MGSAGDHSARLALTAAAILAQESRSERRCQVASARPRWSGEKPSVMNALIAVLDCEFELGDGLWLTGKVVPDWHRS
jgi:hypothetical protein